MEFTCPHQNEAQKEAQNNSLKEAPLDTLIKQECLYTTPSPHHDCIILWPHSLAKHTSMEPLMVYDHRKYTQHTMIHFGPG